MERITELQKYDQHEFKNKAYKYAEKYKQNRLARETFTYNTSSVAEAHHAKDALDIAKEFVITIRNILMSK